MGSGDVQYLVTIKPLTLSISSVLGKLVVHILGLTGLMKLPEPQFLTWFSSLPSFSANDSYRHCIPYLSIASARRFKQQAADAGKAVKSSEIHVHPQFPFPYGMKQPMFRCHEVL